MFPTSADNRMDLAQATDLAPARVLPGPGETPGPGATRALRPPKRRLTNSYSGTCFHLTPDVPTQPWRSPGAGGTLEGVTEPA